MNEDSQFAFEVGDVIAEKEDADKLNGTSICKIKQRFVDVDSGDEYYKIEVLNVWRYIDHYRTASLVESNFKKKTTWTSEEIEEWKNEGWGTCPAFRVDHRPERNATIEEVKADGN